MYNEHIIHYKSHIIHTLCRVKSVIFSKHKSVNFTQIYRYTPIKSVKYIHIYDRPFQHMLKGTNKESRNQWYFKNIFERKMKLIIGFHTVYLGGIYLIKFLLDGFFLKKYPCNFFLLDMIDIFIFLFTHLLKGKTFNIYI
jgi:hypothetical protein